MVGVSGCHTVQRPNFPGIAYVFAMHSPVSNRMPPRVIRTSIPIASICLTRRLAVRSLIPQSLASFPYPTIAVAREPAASIGLRSHRSAIACKMTR